MKKLLVLFAVMFVAYAATAQKSLNGTIFCYEYKGNEIHFELIWSGTKAAVVSKSPNGNVNRYFSPVVEIPSQVVYDGKTYDVVELGNEAINRALNVEKFIIPGSVKQVWVDAFYDCPNLREVVFENGVNKISGKAFKCCPKMEKVVVHRNCNIVGKDFSKRYPKIQIIRR